MDGPGGSAGAILVLARRSDVKSDPGYAYRWLPIALSILALLGLVVLVALLPVPIDRTVTSVRETSRGGLYATVEFIDPRFGQTIVDGLLLPPQHVGADTVPVWPGNESNPPEIAMIGRIK